MRQWTKVNVISIHSEYLDAKTAEDQLKMDGILVAPGLEEEELRENRTGRYARENMFLLRNLLGCKMAVIEYSRNI